MKFLHKIYGNLLFFASLFLLVFIPLYPKIPAIGITHTWVYIRFDDFMVAAVYALFVLFLLLKKAKLKTPLTFPIFLFWAVGLASTIYAVIFIFPTLTNVYPSLAFLNYLRRIEYLGLFFVAFSAIRDKKQLKYVVWTLTGTLIAVVIYGFGQRFLHFPAFLTGNEEFAKGIPLILSSKDRIAATFAGHYDLAAWLVMLIPIMAGFAISYKKWYFKIIFILSGFFGLILLLMTASRVSYMVYLVSISFLLILLKKKKYIIPIIILSLFLLRSFDGIYDRFTRTVSSVDLVVDARTGKAVGIVNSTDATGKPIIEDKQSTGEELPQGTGFINLPGGTKGSESQVTYKRTSIKAGVETSDIKNLEGQFIVKKALAYDVSFTTRIQGTWPRAISAFERNPLTGSGYSSISLASDNNYLRILGEVGILGLLSYASIFLFFGVYIAKMSSKITSPTIKSFVYGVSAALLGVVLNAVLIDVFEASKVAYPMWLLTGLAVGFASLYQKEKINYLTELKRALSSVWFISLYLVIVSFSTFGMIIRNYFVGDDFTWLRWAADCKKILLPNGLSDCQPLTNTLLSYFSDAGGFFYRPGTKVYFYFMYSFFWLNSWFYHVFSILLHFGVAVLVYILALKLLKRKLFAFISAFLFVILAVHYESVFWIASTGHLIASFGMLASLLLYIVWQEKRSVIYLILSLLFAFTALFFHEFAVVMPLLIVLYDICFVYKKTLTKKILTSYWYLFFIIIDAIYAYMRYAADSHWLQGDYNYNLAKLPFNSIGNLIGYIGITLFGPGFNNVQLTFRNLAKTNSLVLMGEVLIGLLGLAIVIYLVKKFWKNGLFKVGIFSFGFFVVNLLVFIGFGAVTTRYVYLPSVGIVIILSLILMVLFDRIKKYSLPVAYAIVFLFVFIYSYFNIIDLKEINKEWYRAGLVTENVITGFNSYFNITNSTPQNPVFYFVDVPIKTGDAWIFPVGLNDALWFTFQNENLTVNISKSLDEALNSADSSASARVFQFNKQGDVDEVAKELK
jgi:hypothetical protein